MISKALNINMLGILTLWASLGYGQAPSVLFVLDGSGSMWGQVEGQPKIEIARTVMGGMMEKLPNDVRAGLMVYGHNRKADCKDIEVIAPVGTDRSVFIQKLGKINPKGKTPLTESVRLAAAQFQQHEGSASVVVVSDGKETCEGDPCMAAREATGAGVNLRIHVIGFDVTPEEKSQLACIAKEGKGKYFSAQNSEQLVTALAEVEKEVVAPNPAPPPPPKSEPDEEIIFEDHFERDELGEMWELREPDPERFALIDGTALSIVTYPEANIAILTKPISDDFTVTLKVAMKIGANNLARLFYQADKSYLEVAVTGSYSNRYLFFYKEVSGKKSTLKLDSLGPRNLRGLSKEVEPWYLQLEKSGRKYTARASIDGNQWIDIGTHSVLRMKDARLGFSARSGGGVENEAAFDDFIVKRIK